MLEINNGIIIKHISGKCQLIEIGRERFLVELVFHCFPFFSNVFHCFPMFSIVFS